MLAKIERWLAWQRVKWWRYYATREPGVTLGSAVFIDTSVVIDRDGGGTVSISDGCQIKQGVILSPYGGSIEIGKDVFIGPYSILYGHGGLSIGAHTLIAGHAVVIPANHTFERTDIPIAAQPLTRIGITIGTGCWLGAGVR